MSDTGDPAGPLRDYLAARVDFEEVRGAAIELIRRAETVLRQQNRRTVQQYVEAEATFRLLEAVPWGEVRDLVGAGATLPDLGSDTLWAAYRRDSGAAVATQALAALRSLRHELTTVPGADLDAAPDRRQLLVRVVRVAAVVAVAGLLAAPIGATLVGEVVLKEVIKTTVATLVVGSFAEVLDLVWKPGAQAHRTLPTDSLRAAADAYQDRMSRLDAAQPFQACAARISFVAAVTRAQHGELGRPTANLARVRELMALADAIVADDTATIARCVATLDPPAPAVDQPGRSALRAAVRRPRPPDELPRPEDLDVVDLLARSEPERGRLRAPPPPYRRPVDDIDEPGRRPAGPEIADPGWW